MTEFKQLIDITVDDVTLHHRPECNEDFAFLRDIYQVKFLLGDKLYEAHVPKQQLERHGALEYFIRVLKKKYLGGIDE